MKSGPVNQFSNRNDRARDRRAKPAASSTIKLSRLRPRVLHTSDLSVVCGGDKQVDSRSGELLTNPSWPVQERIFEARPI